MNIFTMLTLIAVLTLLLAAGLAWVMVNLSNVVTENEAQIEREEKVRKSVNPKNTAGHAIATSADYSQQLKDARKLAAKIAASKKRGANVGIGRLGTTDARADKKHTTKGLTEDPLSALKIAKHHSWNGLEVVKAAPVAAGPGAAGVGAVKTVKRKLVPGKDFQWVEFKGLTGAEKRQAIIANGKAKYAAYKAAKAAGLDTVQVAAAGAAPAQAVAAAPAIELPPAPTFIKIVDGMDPAEKRKAMISNSKAKSAYNKQLKALDINPKDVEWTDDGPKLPDTAQAALEAAKAAAPAAVAAPAAAAAPAAGISLPEAPEFMAIVEGMDPAEKRKAMINNSKAKSAYNKELKASGIDPKTIEWIDGKPQLKGAAAPAPAAPVATAAPAAASAPAGAPPPPEMLPITPDMDPNDKRAAMIANSKAKAAYKKELKALGIDPKSVKI